LSKAFENPIPKFDTLLIDSLVPSHHRPVAPVVFIAQGCRAAGINLTDEINATPPGLALVGSGFGNTQSLPGVDPMRARASGPEPLDLYGGRGESLQKFIPANQSGPAMHAAPPFDGPACRRVGF